MSKDLTELLQSQVYRDLNKINLYISYLGQGLKKWHKEVKVRDLHIFCHLILLSHYDLHLTHEELSQFLLAWSGKKIMKMYGDYYYVNLTWNPMGCSDLEFSLGPQRYKREFEMCREFVDKDFDDFTAKLSIN